MADKFLKESGWKAVVQKNKIKDNGLLRSLAAYEKIEDESFDERLKEIVKVASLAGALRRAKELAAKKEVTNFLADVANAAEFERRQIISEKAAAEKVKEEKKRREEIEREQQELEEAEDENPNAEEEYRQFGKQLFAGIQKVMGAKGAEFQWLSGKKDSTRRMPVAGLMVASRVGQQHKQMITDVTGSKHFATGTCLMEKGKLTFIVDEFAPDKFVTELRRSIKYFTGKSLPVRARSSDSDEAFEEDPDEERDGPEEDTEDLTPEEPSEEDGPPKFVPGVLIDPDDKPAPAKELKISASVGQGGKNKLEDVKAVQEALNRNGAQPVLEVDGKCGTKTVAAIIAFQKKLGGFPPDGVVQPGKSTERGLNGKTGPAPTPNKPTKPNGGGGAVAYEPGEAEASINSPGQVEKTATGFLLFNFGVNKKFIKPEHQKFLSGLVKTLSLDDPNAEKTIIKVSGFSDGVDVETKNSPLRDDRADAVQIFLMGKGAVEENVGTLIKTPAGKFLAPNTTRDGRARNRAVLIELGSTVIDPVDVDPKPQPKSTKSKLWALQSNLTASPPVKPGVAVQTVNFILHDRENKKKFLLQFTGFGGGFGLGFPASVSLPSATPFETKVPVDVSAFNGGGAIRSASAGLGIGFGIGEAQLHVSTVPPQIDIGGFQFSFGADASFVGGTWKILG